MMELVELPGLGGDGEVEEQHSKQQYEGTQQAKETYLKGTHQDYMLTVQEQCWSIGQMR